MAVEAFKRCREAFVGSRALMSWILRAQHGALPGNFRQYIEVAASTISQLRIGCDARRHEQMKQ